jgi:hypothetical protein
MEFSLVDKAFILCAKRNSGKSVLLRYIVSLYDESFNKIFVVCPSETVNHFYSAFIPKENIFEKYEEGWTNKLMARLEDVNGKIKDKSKYYRVLLILDDCCSDVKMHQSDSIKRIFTRGRHCGLSLIITAQYPYQVPPICRANSDFIACGQMNQQGLEILTSEFLMGNIERKEFIKIYHKNTSNYGFLLISNNSANDNSNLNEIYGRIQTPKEFA